MKWSDTQSRRMKFDTSLARVCKTNGWVISILLMLGVCWDLGSIRCTWYDGFLMPWIPRLSTSIQEWCWCKNWLLVWANVPRIATDTHQGLDTPEERETTTWLHYELTNGASHMEYWEMNRSWLFLHVTMPKVVIMSLDEAYERSPYGTELLVCWESSNLG